MGTADAVIIERECEVQCVTLRRVVKTDCLVSGDTEGAPQGYGEDHNHEPCLLVGVD
jgi:hypothetical protein